MPLRSDRPARGLEHIIHSPHVILSRLSVELAYCHEHNSVCTWPLYSLLHPGRKFMCCVWYRDIEQGWPSNRLGIVFLLTIKPGIIFQIYRTDSSRPSVSMLRCISTKATSAPIATWPVTWTYLYLDDWQGLTRVLSARLFRPIKLVSTIFQSFSRFYCGPLHDRLYSSVHACKPHAVAAVAAVAASGILRGTHGMYRVSLKHGTVRLRATPEPYSIRSRPPDSGGVSAEVNYPSRSPQYNTVMLLSNWSFSTRSTTKRFVRSAKCRARLWMLTPYVFPAHWVVSLHAPAVTLTPKGLCSGITAIFRSFTRRRFLRSRPTRSFHSCFQRADSPRAKRWFQVDAWPIGSLLVGLARTPPALVLWFVSIFFFCNW